MIEKEEEGKRNRKTATITWKDVFSYPLYSLQAGSKVFFLHFQKADFSQWKGGREGGKALHSQLYLLYVSVSAKPIGTTAKVLACSKKIMVKSANAM